MWNGHRTEAHLAKCNSPHRLKYLDGQIFLLEIGVFKSNIET